MYDLIHRFAPSSPAGRTAVAIVASLVGVPAAVLGVVGLGGTPLMGLAFLFVGLATLAVAGTLTLGVVRQANAAPDATPLTAPQADREGPTTPEEAETPVETLRRRYATGELSDDEFDRRLERLLETDEMAEPTREREPELR